MHASQACRFAAAWLLGISWAGAADEVPQVNDDRFELTLFAEDTEIVTPIGMAIDDEDRIFVIESHTHHPPADYAGPDSDRINVFVDEDNDGQPDRITVFADGIEQAMNLAFSPEGDLFVACAREVLHLIDENEDGVCDRIERVLKLNTEERYAHNSLMGITFDRNGWMYLSRGNVGSRGYRFEGSDDSTVAGYGDGGNVIRCRPDGSEISEFATGFWNPFDIKFDRAGRLLLVDNDPDARGPNRLVHVVDEGDYGYKSLYGGGGNHPFQGWDGALPGTLGYIAGTGEAPSGLLDCRCMAAPADYASSVLVTIWNENSIERFDLEPVGSTLELKKKSVFIQGGQDFRPVALAADSRGNLFITDWVLVNYPNHGRGRIWRVRARPGVEVVPPQLYFAPYESAGDDAASEILQTHNADALVAALQSVDPVLRHAARRRLADSQFVGLRADLAGHDAAQVRLGALLASRNADEEDADTLVKFLTDPDEDVRRAALVWAGESLNLGVRPHIDKVLSVPPVTAVLFETWLTAAQNLDPKFIAAYRERAESKSRDLLRRVDPNLAWSLAMDDSLPGAVRALAIGRLDDQRVAARADELLKLLQSDNEALVLGTIRRLSALSPGQVDGLAEKLAETALEAQVPTEVRCEALLALSQLRIDDPTPFVELLGDADPAVSIEAARTIRFWLDGGRATECVESIRDLDLAAPVRERLARAGQGALFDDAFEQPQSLDDWRRAAATGGDASRGRRVFFSASVGCTKCHTVDGRGGVLGPSLNQVAASKSRQQIIDAILQPSADFPPQYQAWIVMTTDGQIHRGLQLDHKAGGAIVLTLETGENHHFAANEIEEYAASPSSLMPDGLEKTMSVSEFQDLVSFLESLK